MRVHLHGVGVVGPGLDGWAACREVLAGRAPWTEAALRVPVPGMLPAAERRRCNAASRIALAAAEDALAESGWHCTTLPWAATRVPAAPSSATRSSVPGGSANASDLNSSRPPRSQASDSAWSMAREDSRRAPDALAD